MHKTVYNNLLDNQDMKSMSLFFIFLNLNDSGVCAHVCRLLYIEIQIYVNPPKFFQVHAR